MPTLSLHRSDNKLQLQTFEDQYGELHDWAQGNEIQHFLCHQLYLHFTSTVSTTPMPHPLMLYSQKVKQELKYELLLKYKYYKLLLKYKYYELLLKYKYYELLLKYKYYELLLKCKYYELLLKYKYYELLLKCKYYELLQIL